MSKNEDLYDFLYVDFPMNIFGHAASLSSNTFNILNEIYEDLRDENDLYIVSDEIQKSKPATLFFLSKYGCLIERYVFYSKITLENVFSEFDLLITANPDLLSLNRENLIVVKFETTYNENIKSNYTIKTLDEFKNLYNELKLKNND